MNEALNKTISSVVATLLSTDIAKVETTVKDFPTIKVSCYWCGTVMRIDIKGATRA